jgi:hypothetical protein
MCRHREAALPAAFASRFISPCCCTHLAHAPATLRCFHRRHTLDPSIRKRCASPARTTHVLHAAYVVFRDHLVAAVLPTRLTLTSVHHLSHAIARALSIHR